MKSNFKDQLKNLRSVIDSNVVTLRGLIKQSDQLAYIIEKIGDDGANKETKKSLEAIKEHISKSIGDLVDHTQMLFETYDNLLDEVFSKK